MWLILLAALVIFLFHQLYWRRRGLPGGPMPWPIIGNILTLDPKNIDGQLLDFKKTYGNVMTLWLPQPTVIVSDFGVMKETFIRDGETYAGRPELEVQKDLMAGNYGLAFSYDSFWKSQRRFAMHVLRDFGVGRPILEQTIINQAADVCDHFRKLKGQPTDNTKLFATAVGNIICQLTFGETTSLEDNYIFEFRQKFLDAFEIFNHPVAFLKQLWKPLAMIDVLFGSPYQQSLTLNEEVINDFKRQIQRHRDTIDFEGEPRDYIDAFLMEQKKHNPTLEPEGEWSDVQLIGSVYDLFSAGMETASTTMQMFVFYVMYDPEIQAKIHEEIDRVIGKDASITMADQPKLPYLNACIHEAQRISTLLPLNLHHRMTQDGIVAGYRLPKDTIIIPQFQSVHMDPSVFPNPDKFDPTRYLDDEGKFCKDEKVTPFSIGKRACLGESLARMELFLYLSIFFQHFEFRPPQGKEKMPKLDYKISLVKTPQPYLVRVIERV